MAGGLQDMSAVDDWSRRSVGMSFDIVLELFGKETGCSTVKPVLVAPHGVGMALHLLGKAGERIVWERKVKIFPTDRIHSEAISVPPGQQRQGVGRILNRNLRDLGKAANIHLIEARASTPAGSYFCARCGFLPPERDWPVLRDDLLARLRSIEKELTDRAVKAVASGRIR